MSTETGFYMPEPFNVFDEVDRLCDGSSAHAEGNLPSWTAPLLKQLARRIVLEAASICDRRASIEERAMSIRNEGLKCGLAIRHFLLCHQGIEECCISCNGSGCRRCGRTGIRQLDEETRNLFRGPNGARVKHDPAIERQTEDSP